MESLNEQERVNKRLASAEYQERNLRDAELCARIQIGFTPEEPSEENPKPLKTDGELTEDASEALGELFINYKGLVYKEARKAYMLTGRPAAADVNDIAHEGFYGLFRASLNWNPDRAKGGFLGYAKFSIRRHASRKAEEYSSTIRLPVHARDKVKRYRTAFWQDYAQDERLPKRKRVASHLGMSIFEVDEIAETEALTYQMGSIEGGYFEDNRDKHSTFGKFESDVWKPIDPSATEARVLEDEVLVSEIKRIVQETLDPEAENSLSEREIEVIRLRFFGEQGQPLTLQEVGDKLNVTRERARQIEHKALAKLRNPLRAHKIADLLADY